MHPPVQPSSEQFGAPASDSRVEHGLLDPSVDARIDLSASSTHSPFSRVPQTEAEVGTRLPLEDQVLALRGLSRRQADATNETLDTVVKLSDTLDKLAKINSRYEVDGIQKDLWISELERDDLTGLYLRKPFKQRIIAEIMKNPTIPRAILKIDIGNQKALNDVVSWEDGDNAFSEIGDAIRESDLIGGRYGGDEIYMLADLSSRDESHDDDLTPAERMAFLIARFHNLGVRINQRYPILKQQGTEYNIAIGGVVLQTGMRIADALTAAAEELDKDKERQRKRWGAYRTAGDKPEASI